MRPQASRVIPRYVYLSVFSTFSVYSKVKSWPLWFFILSHLDLDGFSFKLYYWLISCTALIVLGKC